MIKLIIGNKTLHQILCDEEDVEKIQKGSWRLAHNQSRSHLVHGRINGRDSSITLGRYILNYNGPLEVDHKDRNYLNFCKDNLRLATKSQQAANTEPRGLNKYKGVRQSPSNNWTARIVYNSTGVHIGTYSTEEEAARAYDEKAKELFGEFAYLNFPDSIK